MTRIKIIDNAIDVNFQKKSKVLQDRAQIITDDV